MHGRIGLVGGLGELADLGLLPLLVLGRANSLVGVVCLLLGGVLKQRLRLGLERVLLRKVVRVLVQGLLGVLRAHGEVHVRVLQSGVEEGLLGRSHSVRGEVAAFHHPVVVEGPAPLLLEDSAVLAVLTPLVRQRVAGHI